MVKKRGQITVFIIMGILLVAGVFAVLHFMKSQADEELETAQEEHVVSTLEKRDISEYITVCLDSGLKKGLLRLGQQGGFIFKDEEYSIIDFDIRNYEYSVENHELELPNLITRDETLPIASVPIYPCYDSSFSRGGQSLINYKGNTCYKDFYDHSIVGFRFGNLAPEYKNKRVRPGLCSNNIVDKENDFSCGCKPGADCKYSIENQLESFVEGYVKDCVDFKSFRERLGYQVEVGKIEANVSFSDHDTTVVLYFPVSRDDDTDKVEFKDFEFLSSIPVRFKTLYSIVHSTDGNSVRSDVSLGNVNLPGILNEDIYAVDYNIVAETDEELTKRTVSGITLKRISVEGGTVMIISDENSVVDGKVFRFMFFRENRRPALDRLRVRNEESGKYDLYLYENSVLLLNPKGYDPDEDILTYDYEGWKADYDDVYNDDYERSFRQNLTYNLLEDSLAYKEGVGCAGEKERCAEIVLNHTDIGEHELRVIVRDNNGLEDYEDLKIFVDDKPYVDFDVKHWYMHQIPNYFDGIGYVVSVEDPMWFDSTLTKDLVSVSPGQTLYTWDDLDVNDSVLSEYEFDKFPYGGVEEYVAFPFSNDENKYEQLMKLSEEGELVLDRYWANEFGHITRDAIITADEDWMPSPEKKVIEELQSYLDLFDIEGKPGYFSPTGYENKHLIEMKAFSGDGQLLDTKKEDVMVAECMPYRSSVASYPFNTMSGRGYVSGKDEIVKVNVSFNPFMANHTCCLGTVDDPLTWEYAAEGSSCFSEQSFLLNIPDVLENTSKYLNRWGSVLEDVIPELEEIKDEVFIVNWTFWGECNGLRGNVCDTKHELRTYVTRAEAFPIPPEPSAQGDVPEGFSEICDAFQSGGYGFWHVPGYNRYEGDEMFLDDPIKDVGEAEFGGVDCDVDYSETCAMLPGGCGEYPFPNHCDSVVYNIGDGGRAEPRYDLNCNSYDQCCRFKFGEIDVDHLRQYAIDYSDEILIFPPEPYKSCERICREKLSGEGDELRCVGVGKGTQMNCAMIVHNVAGETYCAGMDATSWISCSWDKSCGLGDCFSSFNALPAGCYDEENCDVNLGVGSSYCYCQEESSIPDVYD